MHSYTLIETKNRVICQLASGKKYLSEEDAREQKAQKGPTCWWYAANLLRLRLGKPFDREYPVLLKKVNGLPDADLSKAKYQQILAELKKMRDIEKASSAYRKKETFWYPIIFYIKEYVSNPTIDEEAAIINFINFFLKEKSDAGQPWNRDKIIELAEQVINICEIERIRAAEELFEKIGDKDLLDKYRPYMTTTLLDYCRIISTKAIKKKNGLRTSFWDTKNNIDGLMKLLKEKGPINVDGWIGSAYYSCDSIEIKGTVEQYKVYSLMPDHRKHDVVSSGVDHAVIIVGAEKSDEKQNGFVYLIDPNDESTPSQPRRVYRITYDQFLDETCGEYNSETKCVKRTGSRIRYNYANTRLRSLAADYHEMKAKLFANREAEYQLEESKDTIPPKSISSHSHQLRNRYNAALPIETPALMSHFVCAQLITTVPCLLLAGMPFMIPFYILFSQILCLGYALKQKHQNEHLHTTSVSSNHNVLFAHPAKMPHLNTSRSQSSFIHPRFHI